MIGAIPFPRQRFRLDTGHLHDLLQNVAVVEFLQAEKIIIPIHPLKRDDHLEMPGMTAIQYVEPALRVGLRPVEPCYPFRFRSQLLQISNRDRRMRERVAVKPDQIVGRAPCGMADSRDLVREPNRIPAIVSKRPGLVPGLEGRQPRRRGQKVINRDRRKFLFPALGIQPQRYFFRPLPAEARYHPATVLLQSSRVERRDGEEPHRIAPPFAQSLSSARHSSANSHSPYPSMLG